MRKFLSSKNHYHLARLIYALALLIYAALRQNVTALQPYLMDSRLNLIVVGCAGLIFLWDLIFFRYCLKTRYSPILIAFFALSLLSSVLNTSYAFSDSIKACANLFIQFFVLFCLGPEFSKKRAISELKLISHVFGAIWAVPVVVSVYMYFADIYYTQVHTLWGVPQNSVQGFVRDHYGITVMRLWGVFIDPNFAAVISCSVIFLAIFSILNTKRLWVKILHVLNIFVQYLFVVLSNSRTAFVLVYLTAAVAVWYFALIFFKKIHAKRFIKEILAVALAGVAVFFCIGAIGLTQKVLPYLQVHSSPSEQTETGETEKDNSVIESLERADIEIKGDVSNGRFNMWKEGLLLIRHQPVFGFGPRGYQTAAQELHSDYEVAHRSIHNSYLELLLGNGIFGTLILFVFFLLIVKDALILRFQKPEECGKVGLILCAVLGCLACGMFISSLFYYLSAISVLVFLLSAYAAVLMNPKANEADLI